MNNFMKILIILLTICLIMQVFIDSSADNMVCSIISFVCGLFNFTYLIIFRNRLETRIISMLTMLGVNIGAMSGPLIYQSVTFKAITYNLNSSVETFLYVGLFLVSLTIGHFLYIHFTVFLKLKNTLTNKIFVPLSIFKRPPDSMLWFLGLLSLYSLWASATTTIEYGDAVDKFVAGLNVFTSAPFLIPFLNRNNLHNTHKRTFYFLILYFVILLIFGVVRNSRGVFASVIFSMMIFMFMLYFTGQMRIKKKIIILAGVLISPALIIFSYFSDLAIAMVLARSQRADITGFDFLSLTFNYLTDTSAIENYKNINGSPVVMSGYNEIYINNPIFARLVTIKFDDNMFFYSKNFNIQQKMAILDFTLNKIIALLPTPIINFLSIGLNKADLEYSFGDMVYYLSTHILISGYKLGSMTVHGMLLFSGFYFALVVIITPIIFSFCDSFTKKITFVISSTNQKKNIIYFSPIALIFIFNFYSMFNGDSLLNLATLIFRVLPQTIIIFILTRIIFSFIGNLYIRR